MKQFRMTDLLDYLDKNPAERYCVCSTLGDKTQLTIISKTEILHLAQCGKFHGGVDGVPRIRRMSTKHLDEALGNVQHERYTLGICYNDIPKDIHGTRAYTIEKMLANCLRKQGKYARWIGGLKGSNGGKIADVKIDGGYIEVKCFDGRFNVEEDITHAWLVKWEYAERLYQNAIAQGVIPEDLNNDLDD